MKHTMKAIIFASANIAFFRNYLGGAHARLLSVQGLATPLASSLFLYAQITTTVNYFILIMYSYYTQGYWQSVSKNTLKSIFISRDKKTAVFIRNYSIVEQKLCYFVHNMPIS